ncbi:MAG: hypothetical protein ABR968_13575 [Bacteroidales bacterium]|jgi:hypothetical protein
MKKITLLFCFCVVCSAAFSQQEGMDPRPRPKNCQTENSCPRNSLFLETSVRFKDLFGLVSIDWDHTLICREKYLLSYILGVDFFSFKNTKAAGVPLSLNLMLGGGPLMFELGLGVNYLYVYKNYDEATRLTDPNESYLGMIGNIGLRYEKLHGIFIRAGYIPMYSLMNYSKIPILASKKFNNMFGLGVGYTF